MPLMHDFNKGVELSNRKLSAHSTKSKGAAMFWKILPFILLILFAFWALIVFLSNVGEMKVISMAGGILCL